MKVLITGASGFVAAHLIDNLLDNGHSIVAVVRTQDKADYIRDQHAEVGSDRLSFALVPDIIAEGAFDHAVVSDPPLDAVIHTASPIIISSDPDRVVPDVVEPALRGTLGILKSVHAHAPSVKRVVYTSSFAAIKFPTPAQEAGVTYSESYWNPDTLEHALKQPWKSYSTSKKLAERAAWDFVEQEKPHFDLVALNPPMVFGPMRQRLRSLDEVNHSNERIRDLLVGKMKTQISPTIIFGFTDVRDVALAHAAALEKPEAGGMRYFLAAQTYNNRELAEILRRRFPKYLATLPGPETPGGDYPPEGMWSIDHSRAQKILGLKFRSLEESVVDVVKSMEPMLDAELGVSS